MAIVTGTNANELIKIGSTSASVTGEPSILDDIIDGKGGHDTIYGDAGNDTITGGTGNDVMYGEVGDDTFLGATGDGYDQFFGGDGNDTITWTGDLGLGASFGAGNSIEVINADNIQGNTGNQSLDFRTVTLNLALGGEIDGNGGHDTIYGNSDDNIIRGGTGNDVMYGEGGNDTFVGSTGDRYDQFFGGTGYDIIDWSGDLGLWASFGAGNSIEEINADNIQGDSGNQSLDFRGVTLNLAPLGEIDGNAGHDTIHGNDDDNIIRGGTGNDVMYGEGGNDTFVGSTGDRYDQFFGGTGYDIIDWSGDLGLWASFGAGNSIEEINADNIQGDSGNQSLDFRTVTLNLALGGEIDGNGGHDTIYGNSDDNIIRGGTGNDVMYGEGGNDTFVGSTGDRYDQFFGGAGNDIVDWTGQSLGLDAHFGAANSIETIIADSIDGDNGNQTLDFSRTAFIDVGNVDANGGHDTVKTSLSREPDVASGLVYDGGSGNDRVTVTLAPSDFVGSSGDISGGLSGLIRDIRDSLTADFDAGFTFDDSLLLTVQDFELGMKYGWFTLADNLAEANLSNVQMIGHAGTSIAGTANNDILIGGRAIDTYNAGAGDDLLVHVSGIDRFVTGDGDDTIIAVGDRSGRINDDRETGGTPDTGLDQMFVVGGTKFSADGAIKGLEYIEFSDAAGAGEIRANGTNFYPDFTHTVLNGVNKVTGAGNRDSFITAMEHENIAGGEIVYDGGNQSSPYDSVVVNFGNFTQVDSVSIRSDLIQLLDPSVDIGNGSFTFDQTFNGFDLTIQHFGDTRPWVTNGVDSNRIELGYIGADGDLVTVNPTASHVQIAATSYSDTLNGTAGNDILVRSGNGDILNGGDGDDLLITSRGSGSRSIVDGGEGSDTYLMGRTTKVDDTGTAGTDRILGLADGHDIQITQSLTGIEEINANGFSNIQLLGSGTNDFMDLAGTDLIGIDTVRTFQNADTLYTDTKDAFIHYDGGVGGVADLSDKMYFELTAAQAADAGVAAEIADFYANFDATTEATLDLLNFSVIGFDTVYFV